MATSGEAPATNPQTEVTPPAPSGDRAGLEAAIKARDAAKDEARKAVEKLAELEAWKKSQEEAANQAEEEKRRQQLEKEGEYQTALEEAKKKHEADMASIQAKVQAALLPSAIQAAASKIENITPEAIGDLPTLLRDRIAVDPVTLQPFVKGEDGQPMKDPTTLKPVPVDEFIGKYVDEKPYLKKDTQVVGRGVKPGPQDAPVDGFTVAAALKDQKVMKRWQEVDPEGHKKAFDEHFAPSNLQARATERFRGKVVTRP